MTLNHLCKWDVSDEDCLKCLFYGIIYRCPAHCEHFSDLYPAVEDKEPEWFHSFSEVKVEG